MKIDFDLLDFDDDYIYRYESEPFTGIAFENIFQGQKLSETSFENGVQQGLASEWYQDGSVRTEAYYLKGAQHGTCKEWFESGVLKSESRYEFGILVERVEWDDNGEVVDTYMISSDDPAYKSLEEFRKFR